MSGQEKTYITGFNHGYLLAKYLPELLVKLMKNLSPTTDYLSGFFSGKEEYELEQSRLQLDDLNKLRDRSIDKDLERGA